MRRCPSLALVLVAAMLALPARRASAEPYDLDLARLGAPDPGVWLVLDPTLGASADTLARESRQRFAVLSSEVALALSSSVLQPASTTGHSQFDFDLEMGVAGVHPAPIGTLTASPFLDDLSPWETRSRKPSDLYMPSFHVRKSLPFSFELGGRMIYLSMSSYYAVQGEAKWALNEGFEYIPDLAVRLAYTKLLGQKDWSLGATDLDFMISKRWGVMGVTSFTPYLALRFAFVNASTVRIRYQGDSTPSTDPAGVLASSAAFPTLSAGFYRTTFGLRFTAYTTAISAELTYFGGRHFSGGSGVDDYQFGLASSVSGAFKLGWEF